MKLVRSINGQVEKIKPIWIMRQAGRYLPEYKALRKKFKNFMDFCLNDEMVHEVTLQPVKRFDFDAAIIFSDILIIPHFIGQRVRFEEGIGPILDEANWDQILKNTLSQSVSAIYNAITHVRENLDKDKALIGFVGCPWTITSYMASAGKTDNFSKLVDFAEKWPLFDRVIEKLVEVISEHAISQLKAGANVIQLFESWAAEVPIFYRKKWLFDPAIKIIENIRTEIPKANIIYYGRGVIHDAITHLEKQNVSFGVSEEVGLCDLPSTNVCLQGNLDPKKLRGGVFKEDLSKILNFAKERPFIINLGHGILPDTPISCVEELVSLVRDGCY